MQFKEPIGGEVLSPNHYIEIAKDPGGADGKSYSQPQQVLLCHQIETKPVFKKVEDDKLNKMVKTAKSVYKSVDLSSLSYQKGKLKEAIKLLPEEQFTQIALDNPTQENISALTEELDARWKSDSQIDGHLFAVSDKEDIKSDSKHVTLIKKKGSKQTNAVWSAAFAALNAQYATEPSRPYSTLKVPVLNSSLKSNLTNRNAQLKKYISTYKTNIEDKVFVDRLVTTSTDPEYRSLEVKQTLSAIRYDLKKFFETRFSRFMLVKEDHPFPGPVLSPKSIKTLLISRYRLWQSQNLVQDDGKVTERIRVEASKTNSSKVDIHLPIVTMGQLIISQTQIAFRT